MAHTATTRLLAKSVAARLRPLDRDGKLGICESSETPNSVRGFRSAFSATLNADRAGLYDEIYDHHCGLHFPNVLNLHSLPTIVPLYLGKQFLCALYAERMCITVDKACACLPSTLQKLLQVLPICFPLSSLAMNFLVRFLHLMEDLELMQTCDSQYNLTMQTHIQHVQCKPGCLDFVAINHLLLLTV